LIFLAFLVDDYLRRQHTMHHAEQGLL